MFPLFLKQDIVPSTELNTKKIVNGTHIRPGITEGY